MDLYHNSYWRNGNRCRDNILSIGDRLAIVFLIAAQSHLQCLDNLQTQTCCSTFQPSLHCCIGAIIEFVCHLLAGEGQRNLHDFCPIFCGTDSQVWPPLFLGSSGPFTLYLPMWFADALGSFGKFQLFVFGLHLLLIYFQVEISMAGVPWPLYDYCTIVIKVYKNSFCCSCHLIYTLMQWRF